MHNTLNFSWGMCPLSRLLVAQSLTLAHLQVSPRFNLATSTVPVIVRVTEPASTKFSLGFTRFQAHVLLIKIELSLSHFQLVLFGFVPMPHFLRLSTRIKKG